MERAPRLGLGNQSAAFQFPKCRARGVYDVPFVVAPSGYRHGGALDNIGASPTRRALVSAATPSECLTRRFGVSTVGFTGRSARKGFARQKWAGRPATLSND